jgi:hypothetical protein
VAALTIPSWARKGAKVVCVDAADHGGYLYAPRDIANGDIYTINGVICEPGGAYLVLDGYPNPDRGHGPDIGWDIRRFRPLVEDKSDNEIEAQIYRRKVHQNAAPVKALERT